jgi:two-component system response regulator YesN
VKNLPQLVIVSDDEILTGEMKNAIDWVRVGIGKVFSAINLEQAQEIISKQDIDIMVCSSLDFLMQIREKHAKIKAIVLSSTASITDAQQAIRLGCLDYFLKPVSYQSLESSLQKAVTIILNDKSLTESCRFGNFWSRNQPLLIEHFWFDILAQTISSRPEYIEKAAADRNITLNKDDKFVPVVIAIKQWYDDMSFHHISLMEFALKNLASEMITGNGEHGYVIHFSKFYLLAIIAGDSTSGSNMGSLVRSCDDFIAFSNKNLKCDLSCYIGQKGFAHEMAGIVDELIWVNRRNVTNINKVLFLHDAQRAPDEMRLPTVEELAVILQNKDREEVIRKISRCLSQMEHVRNMDVSMLGRFQQNFLQAMHLILYRKGILAQEFLSNDKAVFLLTDSFRSVSSLKFWVVYLIGQAFEIISTVNPSRSAVERVKTYILHHLGDDLNRDNMASLVFISPDYLTRIFKQQTGLALSQYITRERIKAAKALLSNTTLSIREVAMNVGCTNISHFSKFFRKNTNSSPIEYRQKNSDAGR